MRAIFLVIFLLISSFSIAQNRESLFMLFIDSGTILPVTPTKNSKPSDYTGLNHIGIGFYYLLNDNNGIGMNYSYNHFEAKRPLTAYLKYHKLGISSIFNLGEEINLTSSNSHFKLYSHLGVSLALVYHEIDLKKMDESVIGWPEKITKYGPNHERVGSIDVGISPSYKISDKISLKFDVTLTQNFKTEFGFDGFWDQKNNKSKRSNYLSLSIGLNYYLKDRRKHSKWI